MSGSTLLSSMAVTGVQGIIAAVAPRIPARTFHLSFAVKELLERNLAARERAGSRPDSTVWKARAALQLLLLWWVDDAPSDGPVFDPNDIENFLSFLLTEIDDLWSELSMTAAGDATVVDNALEHLARVSASGVNPRRSAPDASVQTSMDLLCGIRLEIQT
ncbi:MAG: hypothetical protein M3127_03180 [Actinomycetota bacterium]|nr:hypothetical protein [Actinomycetota bacterium]